MKSLFRPFFGRNFLFLGVIFPITSVISPASDNNVALSAILRPGTMLRNLMLPLGPSDQNDQQVLRASTAEIREPPHLLRLTDLRMNGGKTSDKFELQAVTAIYDLRTKTIQINQGFQANSNGFQFKGSGLKSKSMSQSFEISGHFEIQMKSLIPTLKAIPSDSCHIKSIFKFPVRKPSGIMSIEPLTSLQLTQSFARNLPNFIKCWESSGLENLSNFNGQPAVLTMMGHRGGHIDLRQSAIHFDGQSAIMGSRSILVSRGGIQLTREMIENEGLMRIVGQGGIEAWIHTSKSEETWIKSNSFTYMSDRQLFQFEGGPLAVCHGGVILLATENWQFARIITGNRIVLSPGSWNTLGNPALLTE